MLSVHLLSSVNPVTPDAGNRREANKARTRDAVVRAATELLLTEDPDKLTAEKVADAAGISRRTFFNYFPSVDAVFAYQAQTVLDDLRHALAARPHGESLVDGAQAVIDASFPLDALRDAVRTWRVVDTNPAANRYALESSSAAVLDLAQDWTAVRLTAADRDATPLRVSVLTAAFLAAFDTARRAWLAEHPGDIDDAARDDFVRWVCQAIDYLRPAVDAS